LLRTLTLAYSSDTIWALTFLLCAVHLACHDYTFVNAIGWERLDAELTSDGQHTQSSVPLTLAPLGLQDALSLNAGVFASLLLASRLPSSIEVFAFMLFAYEIFAGFPHVAHYVKRYSIRAHIVFTAMLCVLAFYALLLINKVVALVFLLSIFLITFVCPFWLKWVQRYKKYDIYPLSIPVILLVV